MCIVTVMNHGLRNGGGVGDILRKPSKDVSTPARSQTCGAQATVPISKCGEFLASDIQASDIQFLASDIQG